MSYYATKTWYREIEFDSQLEARWAALFDLLHWKWNYHEVCFDSVEGLRKNGPPWLPRGRVIWVPDFSLFPSGIPSHSIKPVKALVEVKHGSSLDDEEFRKAIAKARRALSICDPPQPQARHILFLGDNNRVCFGGGNKAWRDEVDYIAFHLKKQDSGWEETRRILREGLIDHLA